MKTAFIFLFLRTFRYIPDCCNDFGAGKEKYPDFKLSIFDSKAASLGYGLIVKAAAAKAQSGSSKDDIQKDIEFRCQHLESLFTVNDLEYLAKGGRVSKASAFLGGLLNIKPL